MKNIANKPRLVAIAFFAVFSLASAPIALANPGDTLVPVEMKFAGLINDQPVFQLNFNGNPQQNEFTIVVNDEYGNLLYRENVRGENFIKKFLLNTDEIGDNVVHFDIYCNNNKQSVSYQVSRTTRILQDVAFKKIN